MSKLYTIMLGMVCLGTVAFAQQKESTHFGINVGVNSAYATSTDTKADALMAFNAGIYVEKYFSDSWSLKTKIVYDQAGWSGGYINNGNYITSTDYHLSYLAIPVLANWHFGHTGNWYLNFGPYVSFLLSAEETATHVAIKKYFSSTDAGLDLCIGVKFPVSERAKFFIEFNGQGGVTDINPDDIKPSIRNTISSFNVGFDF
mgnify:CR=1 FL=1